VTDGGYSVNDLNKFLDHLAKTGQLKQNTALSRKNAANKILEVLEEEEKYDLRSISVDEALSRFEKLYGMSYKPDSLQVYASRLRAALKDFLAYKKSPRTFKPSVLQRRSSETKDKTVQKSPRQKERVEANFESEPSELDLCGGGHPPNEIAVPVPLRSGLTVQIKNLPADLTESEAGRLSAIIRAYAVQDTV
jgi:hypothetical protein